LEISVVIRNNYLLACSIFGEAEAQDDFWGMLIALAAMHSALRFMGAPS
jgi:hypothetical protein